ncbi:hypothetical protein H5410_011240 [Solanum commersonii]|uniref:Uncharacterized protein n=1 Tax=Solanum commersonii TaxID=4109 RepID=A0A9J6AN33_SOLCO|nr:hypothetical protein H5410_011240 [Solanum commersonii]
MVTAVFLLQVETGSCWLKSPNLLFTYRWHGIAVPVTVFLDQDYESWINATGTFSVNGLKIEELGQKSAKLDQNSEDEKWRRWRSVLGYNLGWVFN